MSFTPLDVHQHFIMDMVFAVEGSEDMFFKYLRQTDPTSFGVFCSCGEYYIGFNSKGPIEEAICPNCQTQYQKHLRYEHPSLCTASDIIGRKVRIAIQGK